MNRGGISCSFMLLRKKMKFLLLGARKTNWDFFRQNVFSLVVKWTFNLLKKKKKTCFGKILLSRKDLTVLNLKKDFILVNTWCLRNSGSDMVWFSFPFFDDMLHF